MTFALALIVEGVLGYLFTNIYRSTTPVLRVRRASSSARIYLPEAQFYATLLSIVILGGALGLSCTTRRTGYAIRATMHNRTAAEVVGVNVDRISMLVFGIGMALAGASGSMLSFLFSFYPSKHWEWVAILLSLVVLGGMGSLLGALIGALVALGDRRLRQRRVRADLVAGHLLSGAVRHPAGPPAGPARQEAGGLRWRRPPRGRRRPASARRRPASAALIAGPARSRPLAFPRAAARRSAA